MKLRKLVLIATVAIQSLALQVHGSSNFSSSGSDTYYDVLGLRSFTGDATTLKKQHDKRIEALQKLPIDPKYNSSNQDEMAKVEEAYKVLSDPHEKFVYDIELGTNISQVGYYQFLGVRENASPKIIQKRIDEIKTALSVEDSSPELKQRATAILGKLGEVQSTLTDKQSRQKYNEALLQETPAEERAFRSQGMETLTATDVALRMGAPFVLGNAGFMLGMWAEMYGDGVIHNDEAMKWAAVDEVKNPSGIANLAAFALGSQAVGATLGSFGVSHVTSNNLGMVVGSLVSHIVSKGFNGQEGQNVWNEFKETYYSTLENWGNHVMRREALRTRIQGSLADISGKNDQKSIEAKQNLAVLQKQFQDESAYCAQHRALFLQALDHVFIKAFKFNWDESKDLAVSTAQLLVTSSVLSYTETTIQGIRAKYALGQSIWGVKTNPENLAKTMGAMSETQKVKFLESYQLAHQFEDLLAKHPEESSPQALSTLKNSSEETAMMARKYYSKYVTSQVLQKLDSTFGRVIPDTIKLPMIKAVRGAKEYLIPDPMGDVEVMSKSLGRRIFLSQTIMQSLWSIPNAMAFVGLNSYLDSVRIKAWGSMKLGDYLNKAVVNLGPLASEYVDTSDSLRLGRFTDYMKKYDTVWEDFREKVISRDVLTEASYWDRERQSKAQQFYVTNQYLHWLVHGSNLNDPDFKANNFEGGGPWHIDPQYKHLFAMEKSHYQNLVIPLNEPKVADYLKFQEILLNNIMFANAKAMHLKLKPLIEEAYYGKSTPIVRNLLQKIWSTAESGASTNWNFAKAVLTDISRPSDEAQNIYSFSQNYGAQNSRFHLQIPGNVVQSYQEELLYLENQCVDILSHTPRTPFVTSAMLACASQTFSSGNGDKFFDTELFNKKQQLALHNSPSDRADMIALSVVNIFGNTLQNLSQLTQKEAEFLSQPENQQQADAITAARLKASGKGSPSPQDVVGTDQSLDDYINSQVIGAPSSNQKKTPQQNH